MIPRSLLSPVLLLSLLCGGCSSPGPQGADLGADLAQLPDLSSPLDMAGPAPHVTSIAPNTGPTTGGSMLQITGTDFTIGATVTIGGVPAGAVQVLSATLLRAYLPARIGGAGAADVTVTNPNGVSDTAARLFTYYAGVPGFAAPKTTSPGRTPRDVATGDFNGDGLPDVAIACQNNNLVSVLLNKGDGSLGAPTDFTVSNPIYLALGDFNNDKLLDIAAVQNLNPGSVAVFYGNGGGSTKGSSSFGVGATPYTAAAGDLNGDGHLDLVVPNYSGGTVSILLSNAAGALQSPVTTTTVASPYAAATGDFNGDGMVDWALTSLSNNTVTVYFGNGAGGFKSSISYGTGSNPQSMVTADLNLDNKPDLIIGNSGSGSLTILLTNGTSFSGPYSAFGFSSPSALAVGDLNGDRVPDVAAASTGNTGQVYVSFTSGSLPQSATAFAAGVQSSSGIAIADMNNDGRPDIVLASQGSAQLSVLLNASQ